MKIGLLLFPNLTQLDLTGPLEVFSRIPQADVSLIWKTLDPVACDTGFSLLPTLRFEDCTDLDIICVPSGPGQIELMSDNETLDFLRRVSRDCKLITSVCTGSLVLAAAGLLSGYKATSHWSSIDQLSLFGVEPIHNRVVRDRDRITGAGVTSGIDFALTVVAELLGAPLAKEILLQIEYDPEPPFSGGSPKSADPEVLQTITKKISPFITRRRKASEAASRILKNVK
ncbi:MAG: DJ-1/PfpI family protein [Paracoccaceae bacterium]